jgi:bacterioferritin
MTVTVTPLIDLLNQALVRELTVCLEYMLQHAVGAARLPAKKDTSPGAQRTRFLGSHSLYYFPRPVTVKKIAIAEMRHAEGIAERITVLGGVPATAPDPYTMADTAEEMIANDADLERGAIALYTEIIAAAQAQGDDATARLFEYILKEEQGHLAAFTAVLAL